MSGDTQKRRVSTVLWFSQPPRRAASGGPTHDGEVVATGDEKLSDPNFTVRGGARMSRDHYAFAFELHLLKNWAQTEFKSLLTVSADGR